MTRPLAAAALLLSTALAAVADGGEPIPALPTPPAEQVAKAEADAWTYMYTHERGAHTNGAVDCGRTFLLAVACWTGDTTGDYRLLKQIRFNLTGDACLVAAGGYASQHERIFTASCVLIRHTPRLWAKLTDEEKHKMDLLMKAALVASAYTTSDVGAADGKQNADLMGGRNLNRGWNPNFQEGMIGMMIVGTIWLGGGDEAYRFLDGYRHAAFTVELRDAGLTNTFKTFSWAAAHPRSKAPRGRMIEHDIRRYTYKKRKLNQLMEIYWLLTTHTYGATVSAGLNNGAGLRGAGRLVSGRETLPNVGKVGMLYEFASGDAGGRRSSITYAYTGYRPNLINQVVMLTTGYWRAGRMADECVARIKIGAPDLYYKLEHGYRNYAKGHASDRTITIDAEGWDFRFMRSLWFDVVEKVHDGEVTRADAGADADAYDRKRDNREVIDLDGSASVAADGATIAAYRWLADDGSTLAETAKASVALTRGRHAITLVVTDSTGRTSRDVKTVVIR